jgi:hypothetical protein
MSSRAPFPDPTHPVRVKSFERSTIVEDDFGFSVRRSVTYAPWMKGDLELFGQKVNCKEELNRETKWWGLEFDDAELLALRIDKAWRLIEPDRYTKKKK